MALSSVINTCILLVNLQVLPLIDKAFHCLLDDQIVALQASTNTILLHFLGIVFANWTLRVLNKDAKSPAPA